MSVTVSNCDQICSSPLNMSKTKMLFSFPKQQRFHKSRRIECDKFYNSTKYLQTVRSATFGFGHKYDLSKTTRISPPCNTYNLKSQFDPFKTQRKGFGFGKGRQEMKITGPLQTTLRNKNPGPGTYELSSTLEKGSYSFTSKPQFFDKQKAKVPGPGYYPITLSTSEKGQYPISKLKNILVRNFSTIIGRRQTVENNAPPPGSYDLSKANLSPEGKYFLSKMQNSLVRSFGKGQRSEIIDKKMVPGPGNYRLPSEFGHYVSKKFKNTLKRFQPQQNKENAQAD